MAFTLEIDTGAGPRQIIIDPEDITLGFLEDMEEAQATNKYKPMRTALCSLLRLSAEEGRALTMRQFRQIGEALNQAASTQNAIPNG
jgi:hypothetical protein